jgi:cytoskeletal protein RodZ
VTIITLKQLASLKLPRLSIFAAQPESASSIDPTPLPPAPADILADIGGKLRQSREQRNMSIEDISLRTRIQPRLLRAIEEGHLEMLPESVYVKGMVKQYGNIIGLNGIEISQRVPNWDKASTNFEQLTARQTSDFKQPRIEMFPVYLGYAVAIFGICGISSFLLTNALNSKHTSDGGSVEPTQQASAPATTPARVAAPRAIPLPEVPVSVVVKSPAWAQIGIDGTTKFTGNLQIGAQLNLTATKQVTISTNNAGGLLFSRDRQPPQPLGQLGEKQQVTIKVIK